MFRFLCGCVFSFLLGMYVGMELLSHMVTVRLFEELSTVFQSCSTILHSQQQCVGIIVLHILNGTYYCL